MVAEHWGCSVSHVHDMIAAGTLQALRLGGLIRITREQIEACETACNTKAALDHEHERTKATDRARALALALETIRRQTFKGGKQ